MSRTYYEFKNLSQCINGMLMLFEGELTRLQPKKDHISYDITDFESFVDGLGDCSLLMLDKTTNQYAPQGKEWIKLKTFHHLNHEAGA